MHRIAIIDDHPLIQESLAHVLTKEEDLTVCAQAHTAEDALDLIDSDPPDLMVVDLSLPSMSGLELVKHLQSLAYDIPILVVSQHREDLYCERVIRAGARGYVMKEEAIDEIVRAIRRVLGGSIYVSESINEWRRQKMACGDDESLDNSPLRALSDRELEIFELTGRGLSTREMAERLSVSKKTVETYRSRLKKKLGVGNIQQLVRRATIWIEGE